MNKFLPYIFGSLLLGALVLLFATAKNNKKNRILDERITFRREDKIPYGTYVAFRNLKYLFPGATISINKKQPYYWDSLSYLESKQALIIVCRKFYPDDEEMKSIIRFIHNGNDVFISAMMISGTAERIMNCSTNGYMLPAFFGDDLAGTADTMNVSLSNPPFGNPLNYSYPGKPFGSVFTQVDDNTTTVFGKGEELTNFIHLKAGKGNIYFHLSPMAFTNYFILHKNNNEYYEKVLSVIKPDVTRVVWDEYFMNKKSYENEPEKKKSWFNVLMNIKNGNGKKPFQAAFWLLISLLVIYVLMEMRRKQRTIPVIAKPRNDSLDFVKTIGRLYYDKGDHKNLCRKMASYFLEHVRIKYKLPTGTLDEEFLKNLQFKSGADESEIRNIVSFIKYLNEPVTIKNNQLTDFHKQLESFYKKA